MKQLILIIFSMIMLLSCNKKDNEIEKMHCITGDWNCVRGVEIINNDTVELFDNGTKYNYWYGERQNSYAAEISLSIKPTGLYHFKETINGLPIDTTLGNIYNYSLNWKLLNTNISNTHILLKIYFEYPQVYQEVFKILELSDDKLVLEARDGIYYMIYSFERAISHCLENEFSMSTIQTPEEIIGDWKIRSSLFKTNDSTFMKYENDTLYNQYYLYVHNEPNPVKVIDKYPYQLELTMNEKGEILIFEKRGAEINDIKSFWYWTDENNPHKRLMFSPTYANGSIWCDYEIELNENELFLKNIENNIEMKFARN